MQGHREAGEGGAAGRQGVVEEKEPRVPPDPIQAALLTLPLTQ